MVGRWLKGAAWTGAVLALAVAATAAWVFAPATAPPEFRLAAAHDADVVWYQSSASSGAVEADSSSASIHRFAWAGKARAVGLDGSAGTDGWAVQELTWHDGNRTRSTHSLDGAGRPVAWDRELANQSLSYFGAGAWVGDAGAFVGLGDLLPANHLDSSVSTRTEPGAGGLPCGWANGFQGRSAATKSPVLHGDCGADADRLEILGTASVPGREGKALVVGNGAVRVWLHPDTAYPLQVERLPDDGDGPVRMLRLVKVETKGAPIDWPPGVPSPPAPTALGPAALAPRTRAGPAHEGIEHPFPLAAAFELASTDLLFHDLSDFLAAHPEAYVSSGSYTAIFEADQRRDVWDFEVSDGFVTLEVVAATPGPAVATASAQAGFGSHSFAAYEVETTAPRPSEAPRLLPSVGGLLERSRGVLRLFDEDGTALRAAAPPAWSFRITCVDADCAQADAWVSVGVAWIDSRSALPLLNSPVKVPLVTDVGYTGRVLQLGGDGAGTAPFLLDSTFSTEASPVPSLEAAPQDAGSALALPTRGQPPALAVGGAALAVGFLAMAAKLALAPLFTRLRSSRLLEHPVRARLHEAVLAEPGIHYLRLQERTGVPRGTLDHHLRKLVEGGILHREQGQGFVCYFAGVPDADALAAAPALKSEAARTLLRLIHGRPGTTAQHLAQELGVQPSSVAHHIDRMVQAGLVERVRAGRAYALAATRRGAKAVGTS